MVTVAGVHKQLRWQSLVFSREDGVADLSPRVLSLAFHPNADDVIELVRGMRHWSREVLGIIQL